MKIPIATWWSLVRIMALILLIPPSIYLYDFCAEPYGILRAHFDLLRNNYRIKVIGHRSPWNDEYQQELAERYSIHVDRVADCLVGLGDEAYWKGYNSVAIPAIKQHYSSDVFRECQEAAIERYMLTRPSSPQLLDYCRKTLSRLRQGK